MFPLNDTEKQNTVPFVTYAIIIVNIIAFFYEISSPNFEAFITQYGFIPAQFNLLNPVTYFPVLTSIFLHGGLMHIAGNLWFLRIFGDNVEDRMGHLQYLVFYLVAGLVATLAQYVISPSSQIPLIGASGAISGVIGAYFVYFKQSKIKALFIGIVGFFQVVELSATFFLGYWFVLQLLNSFGSLAASGSEGGVAFMAHVGGFVFGYLAAKFYRTSQAVTEA